MIRFGPAGLGGVKEAMANLEEFARLGLRACEIAFVYGIYIKEQEAPAIGKKAHELGIKLSIHSPYFINLNSDKKLVVENSKKRLIDCCRIGELLGAQVVVFHPGFYGKIDKSETFENIKVQVSEVMQEIEKNNWKIKIAAETTGKVNVFGSVEEILKLVKETACLPCVDFAHVLARNKGKISYEEIYSSFKHFSSLHCHFSGINFGDKGEINHKLTSEIEMKKLLQALPKEKDITIINESPSPVEDAKRMLELS